ncbi:MAG: hypothetical protein WBV94_29810 [Blastocatellia bacterium]
MKRFVIFISLSILLALFAVAVAGDEKQSLTGAEIVSKHIAAVGGKEAIMKIKSRVAIGVAKKDSDAAVPVYVVSEAPNRVSATYQFEGYNWQMLYDGKQSVVRPVLTRANAPVMQKYQDMLSTGTMFNGISLYNALLAGEEGGVKFEAKGTKKIKGRSAYLVEMRRPKGDIIRLYFDAENFMWLRSDYGSIRLTKEMGGFTNAVESKDQETTYDFFIETTDFKEVDGVKLPFKFEIVATAPILKQKNIGTIITTITEYRHNIPINPKMFQ